MKAGIDGLVAFNGMSRASAELILSLASEVVDIEVIFPESDEPNGLDASSVTDKQPSSMTPIDRLNLSRTLFNILKRNKINFIEQITELGIKGLVSKTEISEATARKIFHSARELLAVTDNVEFEVIQEASDSFEQKLSDQKKLLPEHLGDFLSPENIVVVPNLLPILIKDILLYENRERSYEVLTRRFGLGTTNIYTLDEIGLYYGLTRERVRQLEDKAIKFLRGSLILADFRRKAHRIDERVILEIKNLADLIESTKSLVVLEDTLFNIVQDRYNTVIDFRVASYLRLLFEICGFHPLPGRAKVYHKSAKSAWTPKAAKDSKQKLDEVWVAFDAVYRVLKEAGVAKDLFELTVEVNRPRKKNRLSKWAIETAINLCEDIEILEDGRYQLKLHKLGSIQQQAYRIVSRGPRQVRDARDICKEINLELAKLDGSDCDLYSLINTLAADNRFLPAGRRGWVLKEWNEVDSSSTIDIIHKYFNKLGRPLSAKELYDEISKIRSISENTIYQHLQDKMNFVRVGSGLYQPSTWPINEQIQKSQIIERSSPVAAEEAVNILQDIFKETGQDFMLLPELVGKFSKRTGLKVAASYKNIRQSPAIRLEPDRNHHRRQIAYFITSYQKSSKSSQKVTLRERVKEFVVQYLKKTPLHSAELNKLMQQAKRELKCQKPTFYRYLSEMENVVKTKLETGETICTLVEKKSTLTFPELATIANMDVKAEVERAISLLSLDTIDFCLLHLGKIFEHTVTEYVDLASAKRVISATDHDKRNLANRLDCLVRNGIITNKRTVDYLRQERNARAHELGERQTMMREAPELARLYVKNIADLQEKIVKLR